MSFELEVSLDQATAFFTLLRQRWSIFAHMFSSGPFQLVTQPTKEMLTFKGRTLTLSLPVIDPKKKLLTRRLDDIMRRGWSTPKGDRVDLKTLQLYFAELARGLPFLTNVNVIAGFDTLFDTRNGFINPPSKTIEPRDYPKALHALMDKINQVGGSPTTSVSVIKDTVTKIEHWGVSVLFTAGVAPDIQKKLSVFVSLWVVQNYQLLPEALDSCSLFVGDYYNNNRSEVVCTQLGRTFTKGPWKDWDSPGYIRATKVVQKLLRSAIREQVAYVAWDHPIWAFSSKNNIPDPHKKLAPTIQCLWAQSWVMRKTFRYDLLATNTKLYVTYHQGDYHVDVVNLVKGVVAHVLGRVDVDWTTDSWNTRAKKLHSRALHAKKFLEDTSFTKRFVLRGYDSEAGYFVSAYARTSTKLSFGKWMELQQKL